MPSQKISLDKIDMAILNTLQEDSTVANAELASRVGLSASACLGRTKRLRETGFIRQYVAVVDEERVGLVLSGGEREQVHLAVRLALAELLTKDAGQKRLVVLDDVMTATDDERLGRVIAVLEEMRSHAQFVILTCHPERYKPLKGAKFIDMANLRN